MSNSGVNNPSLSLPLRDPTQEKRRHSSSRQPRMPSMDEDARMKLSPAVQKIELQESASGGDGPPRWISVALREKIQLDGYTATDLRQDILAGFVVGMVAMPLGMALGIATGVTPQLGLYTVIVAGFITSLLGGSRFQVSGPTAAFVVILEPIVANYGVGGLLVAGMMSGIIVVLMGLSGMGKLIHYMPDTVTRGFTLGIAFTIGAQQLNDFLGISLPPSCSHFLNIIWAILNDFNKISFQSVMVASTTLAVIILFPRFNKKIPAPLVAITLMTLVIYLLEDLLSLVIPTIGSRFSYVASSVFDPATGHNVPVMGHGIPPVAPTFTPPWRYGDFTLDFQTIYELIPSAVRIALLGSIESLLSAVIADGMAEQREALSSRHDPDCELVAIGISNIVAPFFGGIPATGAIARTATNIKFGAKSPVSAMVHSVFALLCVVVFAPVMSKVPMASLAALLLFVAYNMGEPHHFVHLLKTSPRDDKIVLLSCFGLTVVFDMVIGVFGGLIVAAALFAKQMTRSVSLRRGHEHQTALSQMAGKELLVFEMNGPLFFGTAKSMETMLEEMAEDTFVSSVVLIMDNVPVMDISGALSMAHGVDKVLKSDKSVFLVGIRTQPLKLLRHHLPETTKRLYVMDSMAALHEAVSKIHDIPATPHLRWIDQSTGSNRLVGGNENSRQQIQGDMVI